MAPVDLEVPAIALTPTKRSMPQDFFQPSSVRQRVSPRTRTLEEQETVPGLTLLADFISHAEQKTLLHFLDSPACTWRTDLSRRTMHFGGTYCLYRRDTGGSGDGSGSGSGSGSATSPEILQAPPIPAAFDWLLARLVACGVVRAEAPPTYCIVNEYREDQGISAHTENFSFDEPVVGLSLLAACPMRFRELERPYDGSVRSGKAGRAPRTGRVVDVRLPARSLLVMRGEARWRWQHEILRSGKGRGVGWRRVSLTFRVKMPARG